MSYKLPVLFCDQYDNKLGYPNFFEQTLRQNYKSFRNICSFSVLNICCIYPGLLGLIGAGLCMFDIVRIINCGSELPSSLWRSRIKAGKIVSAKCERDLKLISLVLSLEYYILLVFGTITQKPILFLPWLILHTFIIMIEFLIFTCRLFTDGFTGSKHGLALSIFMVYNWLCTFCAYFQLTTSCGY